jgi:PPK2 family polyphosphate:nucleotide phosphotransferase
MQLASIWPAVTLRGMAREKNAQGARGAASVRDALRVQPGAVNLAGYETLGSLDSGGKKSKKSKSMAIGAGQLAGLQERLFAEHTRSLLLVLQGIDTAGKGGVVSHVVGLLGPEGVICTAFKQPSAEEQAHHFLWRIRKRLPGPGMVSVFDRSHYEDVLVPRVHELIPEAEWRRRYQEINEFEAGLAETGTTVVKCFLHISYTTQRERLLARLSDPDKRWKFQVGDINERAFWSDYEAAFAGMLQECSTEAAPWYVVPSDDKPFRNWAVGQILAETLTELDPQYPRPDLDLDHLRARLAPPH